ncbi:hypothetical protein XENOCAPTIV_004818, partial [Xenoophorus captivus]
AINAAAFGVVGVLVYTDPLDINDGFMSDTNETYPHSWYLPPTGVERGSYNKDFGDLLTPYLAAKGFVSHQAVGRSAGNILIRLADSLLLPFNCNDYAESLEDYLNTAVTLYEAQLKAKNISMGKPLNIRKINDQLMLMDRAFLNPLAFPDEYGFR